MIANIDLSPSASAGIQSLGFDDIGDHGTVNFERMAWIALVLRSVPDSPQTFPRGKWATIQSIERQLWQAARDAAAEIVARLGLKESES